MVTHQTDSTGHRASGASPSRKSNWKVRAALSLVAAIVGMLLVLWFAGNSGGTLEAPVGAKLYEVAIVVIAAIIVGVGVYQSVRERRISKSLLISVSSATAFWQETYGDWGTYLLYSPRFVTYGWQDGIWTAPNTCWWFIAGYIFFYTTFLQALEKTFYVINDRWPGVNPYFATTAASFPLFYVFDLTFEGAAHGFGWWNYQYSFGPSLAIGSAHFPLLWPILGQVPFMVIAVFAMTWRSANGDDIFELFARKVTRRKPGQIGILMSWIILVNVTFLVTPTLQEMVLRWIAGPASATVP